MLALRNLCAAVAAWAGAAVALNAALAGPLPEKFQAKGACAAQFGASKATARGVDVSKFQGDINRNDLNRQGLHFVMMRAAYGKTPDPDFARNWKNAADTCMLRAPYQFFVEDDDPEHQGEAMHKLVRSVMAGVPDLPPVVDVESGSTKSDVCKDAAAAKRFVEKLVAYVKAFESATGHRLMIYTADYFWKCLPSHPELPGGRPLWVASYTDATMPDMPPGWKEWTFWQRTDRAKAEGINAKVDGDRFNGSPAAMLEFAAQFPPGKP